jgi:exopolyphosphatase/guanosine-5'-triphosphate,3'-diphosphate pyrophosphatase
MRVATIDIGTNTVLLLVAERGTDGSIRAIHERAEITRLGEGVDRSRMLSAAAVERTVGCLARYAREIEGLNVDKVAVVGTSAMRDAPGGASLASFVRTAFGIDARVLSGEEEARLTFRGALRGLGYEDGSSAAVFDIGGGSTEVVMGRLRRRGVETDFVASFDVGSVRLTERCIRHDPPRNEEVADVKATLLKALATVPDLPPDVVPVGVAGTMTTLAAVALAMPTYDGARVHGHLLGVSDLRDIVGRLSECTLEARRSLPGMEPKRADVIVAGGHIALALLERWSAPSVRISDGGVRWGLAEELFEGLGSQPF